MSINEKTSTIWREKEELSRLQTCSKDCGDSEADCLICRNRFVVQGDRSNKCPECLKKVESISSGFPFKFEAELPFCNHVMCAQCFVYYEQEHQKSPHE